MAHEKLTDGVPYLVWGHSAGFPSGAVTLGNPKPWYIFLAF